MKTPPASASFRLVTSISTALLLFAVPAQWANAAPATLLFQEDFNNKLPGWTAVKPAATYIDGDMLWVFNKLSDSFGEQSNIYTDSSAGSVSRIGVLLINDAVAPASGYSYTARLTAGDDDGFGLVW